MREIKYRAWLNKQQRMIDVEAIKFIDIGGKTHAEVTAKVDHEKGGWYTEIREPTHRKTVVPGSDRQVPRAILRQYTGLKDKNGIEVYEGDILKGNYMAYTNFNVVVKFGEYKQDGSGAEYTPSSCIGFYAEVINKDQEDEWGFKLIDEYMETASLFDFMEIEVIGNIYENPELLEVD